MTYGVTFTCHVRDHGTILAYKPAGNEDAALLPSDPGARAVCAPYIAPAGTSTTPSESFSFRVSAI
jgi:hypothetical protein